MLRIVIVGAGRMARVRARAVQAASVGAEICGVASRRLQTARAFAEELDCRFYTDDYRELSRCRPDAVLIEVPHRVQDEVALWALASGLHVLIGGCLATNTSTGKAIARMAEDRGLIVEAGYEARYKDVWRLARDHVMSGHIGDILAIRSVAYHDADPASWYYDEALSGGMIVTHMSYTFLNPLRWIFGAPRRLSAFASKKHHTGPDKVRHETCTVNLLFAGDVICNMTASYVKPRQLHAWNIQMLGTNGSLDIWPGDMEPGALTVYSNGQEIVTTNFSSTPNAFAEQAAAFLSAIHGTGPCAGTDPCLNPARDAMVDVQIAEAIARSADENVTLQLQNMEPKRA